MADEKMTERLVTPAERVQERQRVAAREVAEHDGRPLDETQPGGRYINDSGDLVDANGQPLKGKG